MQRDLVQRDLVQGESPHWYEGCLRFSPLRGGIVWLTLEQNLNTPKLERWGRC